MPRGRALGAAWYAPEARQIIPTQALLDTMCGMLAGRAAEEVFLGQIGTGASDDLEKCTKIARSMVMVYGMTDKLPNINYNDSTGQDYGFVKPYSEDTAKIIDEEVARVIAEQYDRAKSILKEYAEQHNKIRDLLMKQEVIYHDDVEAILGKRKWKSRTDEIMELNAEDERRRIAQSKESDNKKDSESHDVTSLINEITGRPNPNYHKAESKQDSSDDNAEDDDPGTPPEFKHSDDE